MTGLNMKSFVSGIMVGTIAFSAVSYAAPNAIKLVVNGAELHTEVPAQIIDGSTMIPARGLAEALGALVTWDPEHQAVIIESDPFGKASVMDSKQAAQLAGFAQKLYWTVGRGGAQTPEGAVQTFTVQGKQHDYRWMGVDLDTKAKVTAFLERAFTPEQVAAFLDQLFRMDEIVEVDGKLAQVNADGSSLMSWRDSRAVVASDSGTVKIFHFSVPAGDNRVEVKNLKIRFLEGTGWRIDSPIHEIH